MTNSPNAQYILSRVKIYTAMEMGKHVPHMALLQSSSIYGWIEMWPLCERASIQG